MIQMEDLAVKNFLSLGHANQVSIDFVNGSHGRFLEFVCNKFIANLPDKDYNIFNTLGASHNRSPDYYKEYVFLAKHFSICKLMVFPTVIRIRFETSDLLNLHSVSMWRAADDVSIDNDVLEQDTYNKLNNKVYISLLDNLCVNYPDLKLSESNPDCPRYVLREFFKFGFKDPENHGLMQLQRQMTYDLSHKVFDFDFKNFYNTDMFVESIETLALWLGYKVSNLPALVDLHHEFLQKQIYKDSKTQADDIILAVQNRHDKNIPRLSLLQESYINATLENLYQVEMPFVQPVYFSTTAQILKHLYDTNSNSHS